MTLSEASRYFGKSETTIRRWIKQGKLTARVKDRKYEIEISESPHIQKSTESSAEAVARHLTSQMDRQAEEIAFLRNALSEQAKRHDAIVLQLTQQLSHAHLQLEAKAHQKLWQRVKSVLAVS